MGQIEEGNFMRNPANWLYILGSLFFFVGTIVNMVRQ